VSERLLQHVLRLLPENAATAARQLLRATDAVSRGLVEQEKAVELLRASGVSWGKIANLLGISAEGARKKYGTRRK
jgi:DNA-directed RNA polymerase specialized sigma24 family protein